MGGVVGAVDGGEKLAGVAGEEGGVGEQACGEGGKVRGGGVRGAAVQLEGLQFLERGGEDTLGAGLGAGEAFEAGFGAIGEAGCGGEAFDGALQGVEGGLGGGDLTDKEEFEFACGGVFSGELRGALGDGVAGCGGGKRHEEIPCAVSVEACKGRARVGKA